MGRALGDHFGCASRQPLHSAARPAQVVCENKWGRNQSILGKHLGLRMRSGAAPSSVTVAARRLPEIQDAGNDRIVELVFVQIVLSFDVMAGQELKQDSPVYAPRRQAAVGVSANVSGGKRYGFLPAVAAAEGMVEYERPSEKVVGRIDLQ